MQPHRLIDARVEEGEFGELRIVAEVGAFGDLGARALQQLGVVVQVDEDPRERDLPAKKAKESKGGEVVCARV